MELLEIAREVKDLKEKIILIYAFNTIGKTRLSVDFKQVTKSKEGQHSGVYYNAFSEDLFTWDNDTRNGEANIRLLVTPSSLNKFHSALNESNIFDKLEMYKPKFKFRFDLYDDPEKGIESISFYIPKDKDEKSKDKEKDDDKDEGKNIKISRGEERIFIWCFFLALFEVEGWADRQRDHFFIDDPVSSLDDHNIFVTAATIFELIEHHYKNRKFIITTHHIGLFSILADWLKKGEKSSAFQKETKLFVLSKKSGELTLENPENDVFLYHLHLLQTLESAQDEQLYTFHFALLRQILENIASFLGVGQFGYVLEQIGIKDQDRVANIVNTLSHQKVYRYQMDAMTPDNEELFRDIFQKIKEKYNFVLHAG